MTRKDVEHLAFVAARRGMLGTSGNMCGPAEKVCGALQDGSLLGIAGIRKSCHVCDVMEFFSCEILVARADFARIHSSLLHVQHDSRPTQEASHYHHSGLTYRCILPSCFVKRHVF